MANNYDNEANASGVSDVEPTIDALAHEFNKHDRSAAEHIVLGGKAVSQAKAKGDDAFVEFCATINYDRKSSKLRKYKRIGDEAHWLWPIVNRLPADWTTIFDVAVLGQAKAEVLIHRGILTPQMSGKDLKAAKMQLSDDVVSNAGITDEEVSKTESCVLQVDASGLSDTDRIDLYLRFQSAAKRHGLTVSGLPPG